MTKRNSGLLDGSSFIGVSGNVRRQTLVHLLPAPPCRALLWGRSGGGGGGLHSGSPVIKINQQTKGNKYNSHNAFWLTMLTMSETW